MKLFFRYAVSIVGLLLFRILGPLKLFTARAPELISFQATLSRLEIVDRVGFPIAEEFKKNPCHAFDPVRIWRPDGYPLRSF